MPELEREVRSEGVVTTKAQGVLEQQRIYLYINLISYLKGKLISPSASQLTFE